MFQRVFQVVENGIAATNLIRALSLRRDKKTPHAGTRNSLRNTQGVPSNILKIRLNLRRILDIMVKNGQYSQRAGKSAQASGLSRMIIQPSRVRRRLPLKLVAHF
jgi:hypothetical protein